MKPSRLAVLGAGHVGPVIARLALKAGHPVAIATSGDPESLALITELMIPGAQPRWARDAVAEADIVVLALPLHRLGEIDPGLLNGKLVVDATNYWPATEGVLEAFSRGGSSEIVARRLAGSTVVKALNHRPAWTSSGSASITPSTSRCRPGMWYWPRSRRVPKASASAPPSPC
jgi:predicted dinucleotide-binding enzyme